MKMNGNLTRRDVFQKLFELENQGISIQTAIEQMANKSDNIPQTVLEFLEVYETYPIFIEKLKQKKFYQVITNNTDDISVNDKAKALSSLITHTLIESELINQNHLNELANSVYLKEVITALNSYIFHQNPSLILNITEKLKKLFLTSQSIEN